MSDTLRIRNWDKWQSYRKGRGQPSWIKLHRRLLRDENWVALTDAQRGQLVAIWLLAADRHGTIPSSSQVVQKLCMMELEPDFQVFVDKGFIESDSQVAANCQPSGCQVDANVTPQNRIEENRKEGNGARAPYAFVGRVISLNQGDYDQWVISFPNVDLKPYLEARDVFLFDLSAEDNRRRKWMTSTASDLRNKNNAPARPPPKQQMSGRLPSFKPEPEREPITPEERARRLVKADEVKRRLRSAVKTNRM